MRAPEFWRTDGPLAILLSPLSWLYERAGRRRLRRTVPVRLDIPVICIGNAVAGGAGKTPIALAVAALLHQRGQKIAFVSRGHGGSLRGPVRVDPAQHTARDVGDEPLLLAQSAPTFIARDRAAAAKLAAESGAQIVIMDDGFQNPSLHKDLSLLVIDGGYGFGNGRVLPAGPLRERAEDALARADAIVMLGDARERFLNSALPVLQAHLVPRPLAFDVTQPLFAFAGIGRPEKFFETLRQLDLKLAACRSFPDHHPYRERELHDLAARAEALGALPVTTRKDWMRLPEEWRGRVAVVDVAAEFEDKARFEAWLETMLAAAS